MNDIDPTTLWAHAQKHFTQPEPVQPIYLEDAAGVRQGGVIFIRGEREFELVKSLFKTTPKGNPQ